MNPFLRSQDKLKVPEVFKELTPQYLHPKYQMAYKLYRYDKLDTRYYTEFNQEGQLVDSYISITSLAQKIIPDEGGFLGRWQAKKGWEVAQNEKMEKAAYGTVFHAECLDWLVERRGYTTARLAERIYEKCPPHFRQYVVNGEGSSLGGAWVDVMKKDLMCWFQFVKERVKEVWAVEISLRSKDFKVCSTLDLVAEVEFNNAARMGVIDLKSGKRGFYDAHLFQLEFGKKVWNETFPEKPVTHLFNWAPIDFKKPKEGIYKLQNQTGKKYSSVGRTGISQLDLKLEFALEDGLYIPKQTFSDISINFVDVKDFDPTKSIKTFSL